MFILTKRSLTVGSLKNGVQSAPPKKEVQVVNTLSKPKPEKSIRSEVQSPIKILQNQTTYLISPQKGKTLLNAALAQNQMIEYKCTKGTCGRCKVRLIAGGESLSGLNEKEQEKLKGLTQEGYRLACQAVFR